MARRRLSIPGAFLVAAMAVALPSPARAGIKEIRGIFAVTHPDKPFADELLASPRVDGIMIRTFWREVEPSPGDYRWEFIDRELRRAEKSGKKVVLLVLPGAFTPPWALQGVRTGEFTSTYGYTVGERITLPLPWDEAYLERWYRFIGALGRRYDGEPAVVLIPVAGPTSVSAEMSLPNQPESEERWRQMGYTTPRFREAWRRTLEAFGSAFPTTRKSLTLYPWLPFPNARAAQRAREELLAEAVRRYGQGVTIETDGLSARREERLPRAHGLIEHYSRHITTGFMMSTSATKRPERMGGSDSVEALAESVRLGLRAGAGYLLIYEDDLLNPELAATVDEAHRALSR